MNLAVEAVGYLGSALVALSLTMTSQLRFRLISLAGSLTFLTYGLLIGAPPVVITNVVIVAINLWFLWKAKTDEEYYSLLEVAPSSRYLAEFLEFHRGDIARYFPGFGFDVAPDDVPVLVLRDLVPAALFIGRPVGGGVLHVRVDYAVPRFRDLGMGRFLYQHSAGFFVERGFRMLRANGGVDDHRGYLKRIGFTPADGDCFELAVGS